MSSQAEEIAILNFLQSYLSDKRANQTQPLEFYQRQYVGFEKAIQAEFDRLQTEFSTVEEKPAHPLQVGPYVIEREIGRGGQGVVYLARDTRLPRQVALKVLRGAALFGDQKLTRFKREADALSRLDHSGISGIIDVGAEDGLTYIAMRHISGRTLAEHIRDQSKSSQGVETRDEAADGSSAMRRQKAFSNIKIIEQCAQAMHSAHEAGIIHRDIKPGNIIIGEDGRPVLFDFGLARDLDGDISLTESGDLLGTPGYMSPEQVEGRTDVGVASDIWALGITLFETLTLTRPFSGATRFELARKIREAPTPSLRSHNADVPRDLEIVLSVALDKNPHARYTTAEAFAEDLRRVRHFEPITARPTPPWRKAIAWGLRNRALAVSLISIALLLIAATIISVLAAVSFSKQSQENQQIATAARRGLYFAEMNLAGLANQEVGGASHVRGLLEHWDKGPGADLRGWEWYHLDAMTDRERLTREVGVVATTVDWHPTRSLVAAGTFSEVAIFDPTDGRRIATLPKAGERVFCSKWSPQGHRIAASGSDGVRIWKTGTWEETHAILPKVWIQAIAFDPSGRLIAAHAGNIRVLYIIDSHTGGIVKKLENAIQGDCSQLSFSRDGKSLAGLAENERVALWDTTTWEMRKSFDRQINYGEIFTLLALDFEPGERHIAACGREGCIKVWDVKTSKITRTFSGHDAAVTSLAYSPDGTRLASAGWDKAIRLWDSKTGTQLDIFKGHDALIRAIVWSPDGHQIASVGEDGFLRFWDMRKPSPARSIPTPVGTAAPQDLYLNWESDEKVGISWDHPYQSFSLSDATWSQRVRSTRKLSFHRVSGRRLSTIAKRVVVASLDGSSTRQTPPFSGYYYPRGIWHPKDNRVIILFEKTVHVWDLDQPDASPMQLLECEELVTDAAWLDNGDRIALTHGVTLDVLDLTSGKVVGSAYMDSYWGFDCLATNPDHSLLAASGATQIIYILDTADLSVVRELDGHTNKVVSLSWSPDGQRLSSASTDGTVRIWDPEFGALCLTFNLGTEALKAQFSPNGQHLAAISKDLDLHIWSINP